MKFRLVILYSFILFTMSSCKLLVRIITGVRQPKIESSASVISFVKKNGINSDQIFYIDSAASWKFWELHQMENILDVRIYDSKGRLLKYLPQAQCSGTVAKNLREINLPALLPIAIASDSLSQVLRNFRRVDNKMLQLSDFKEGDFIVGIYCLKAFGNAQFEHTALTYTNELNLNPSASHIRILYLDTDMHESWGMKSKDDSRYLVFDF